MIRMFQLIVNGDPYEVAVEVIPGQAASGAATPSVQQQAAAASPAASTAPVTATANKPAAAPSGKDAAKPAAPLSAAPAPKAPKAPAAAPVKSQGQHTAGADVNDANLLPITAPLSATVYKVNALPGSAVYKGHAILLLEAENVEHAVLSPIDSTVHSLCVESGMTVNAGDLLYRLIKA